MVGLVKVKRLGPMGPWPSGASLSPRSVPRALRSAPPQNVPPAPQSTATRRRSSCSNSRNASASTRAAGPSMEFRASGRAMMIVATASCRSSLMAMRGLLRSVRDARRDRDLDQEVRRVQHHLHGSAGRLVVGEVAAILLVVRGQILALGQVRGHREHVIERSARGRQDRLDALEDVAGLLPDVLAELPGDGMPAGLACHEDAVGEPRGQRQVGIGGGHLLDANDLFLRHGVPPGRRSCHRANGGSKGSRRYTESVAERRILSIDVFRGLTVAGMVLVNNPGTWGAIYAPLRHPDWHGWTPPDLISPFFPSIPPLPLPPPPPPPPH